MRSSARWQSARSAPRISAAMPTLRLAARRSRIWWIRALLSLPPCGGGSLRCEASKTGEGLSPRRQTSQLCISLRGQNPSSGASRHLLPQGEKVRAPCSASRPRDLLDRRLIQPELLPGLQDLLPGGRIDRNAFSQALLLRLALRLAGDLHLVDADGGRGAGVPGDEALDFAREILRGAELGRIDDDREHAVEDVVLAIGRALDHLPAGERAAEDFAHQREPRPLVLAERQDGAVRRDHGVARVGGRLALIVDDGAGLELDALVVGDAGLALRDPAGGEVEHDGVLARARDADAERIGAVAPIAAAPRRHDRARDHVDEVNRDQSVVDALLGPVADAADVVRVRQADETHAVALGPLGSQLHRFMADDLAVAGEAVEGEQRTGVEHDLDVLVHGEAACGDALDIAWDHADAVGVVSLEIGLDQIGGYELGFAVRGAAGLDDGTDGFDERLCLDGAIVGHCWCSYPFTILRQCSHAA